MWVHGGSGLECHWDVLYVSMPQYTTTPFSHIYTSEVQGHYLAAAGYWWVCAWGCLQTKHDPSSNTCIVYHDCVGASCLSPPSWLHLKSTLCVLHSSSGPHLSLVACELQCNRTPYSVELMVDSVEFFQATTMVVGVIVSKDLSWTPHHLKVSCNSVCRSIDPWTGSSTDLPT